MGVGVSLTGSVWAGAPVLRLGPADDVAMDQARLAFEVLTPNNGPSLGPKVEHRDILLATGSSGILIVDDAVTDLVSKGYVTQGTYNEVGLVGPTQFNVSAPYDLRYANPGDVPVFLEDIRVLSNATESYCPINTECTIFGLLGMPAVNGRVTTFDLGTLSSGDPLVTIDDLINDTLNFELLETKFAVNVPGTTKRRMSVVVEPVSFALNGGGPLPTWSDLPQINVTTADEAKKSTGKFVLDTGAQLSVISSATALALGLDKNGNGSFDEEAVAFHEVGGIGGEVVNAPVVQFDSLRIPTEQGTDLVFTNLQMAVVDIDPNVAGIFGMNFLTSGASGVIYQDLADLGPDLGEDVVQELLAEVEPLGINNDGSPVAYFDKVHMDFRTFNTGGGRLIFDLADNVGALYSNDLKHGDLDNDGDVDLTDRTKWIHEVENSHFGDANLDGVFSSTDLIKVFVAGQYNDNIALNSVWESGDWNGDCEFDPADLILAMQDGGYDPLAASPAAVPEPAVGLFTLLLGAMGLRRARR